MRKKFELWCMKANKNRGKEEKLYASDKLIITFIFSLIPKIIMFLIVVALAMRGYEKYGIERTMIVISWILIYTLSLNLASIRNMNKVMLHNQLEFFKNENKKAKKGGQKP